MGDLINYLITFLVYGNKEAARLVGYTAEKEQWSKYKVVIVPSGNFGKRAVLPNLGPIEPLREGDTIVIHNDIVYNTFFFASLVEEGINSQRDEHDRFLAKHSILGQNNRLQIPLVDEYSRTMLKLLDLPMPEQQFSSVYLTHDIDTIAFYRHLRGMIGGVLRGHYKDVKASCDNIYKDPAFTFPWLQKQDNSIADKPFPIHVLYFAKDTLGEGYDYPQYNLNGADFEFVARSIHHKKGQVGWHSSYYHQQPKRYSNLINYSLHRSHYLRCPLSWLEKICHKGVVHDFSIGFPDQAGFRLQTTRSIQWINPTTYELTPLTLHPLTIMDVTLSEKKYMHLDEDEAYFYCQRLFDKVRQNNGELTLLWHNTSINTKTYHKSLYPKLLQLI